MRPSLAGTVPKLGALVGHKQHLCPEMFLILITVSLELQRFHGGPRSEPVSVFL